MTVKFTRASNQAIFAGDNAAFSYPNGDWALAFVIGFDGVNTAADPQYFISNGAFQSAGSLGVLWNNNNATSTAQRGRLVVYTDVSSAVKLTSINQTFTGHYLFVLQRSGTSLTLRRCPVLTDEPFDSAAVLADGSATLSTALDGAAGMYLGGRADLLAARAFDQSLGRVFRIDGTLTDMEVARLAYGLEVTDIGKSPAWYLRMNDADDLTDLSANAIVFAKSGAPTTSPAQPPFGYAPTVAPVITGEPSIAGTPQVDAPVGYTPASVTGVSSRSQQWRIDGVNISGATSATYTPVAGDLGKSLSVRQIETNGAGTVNAVSAGATVAASGSATTVDVTAPTAERVYQRIAGAATVALAGVYTGAAPASLEYQLYASDGVTVLHAWAALVATIGSGVWSASPSMPAGGANDMYRIAVRGKEAGGGVIAVSTVKSNLFAVGDIFACIGSSSAEYWFLGGYSGFGLTASPGVRKYDAGEPAWSVMGTSGCAITIANGLSAQLGVPVALIDAGKNGDTLAQWNSAGSASRTSFDAAVAAVGGKLAGVLISVGGNDAAAGNLVSRAAHRTNMRALVTAVRNLTGQAALPVLWSGSNRRPSLAVDQANYMRMAENDIGDDADVYHIQTCDFELSGDNVHLSAAGFGNCANRIHAVFGSVLVGGAYRRGPKITALTHEGATLTATLEHRGAVDFTPTTGITGFAVSDASGTPGVLSVARATATRVAITCDRPLVAPVVAKYMSGGAPDISASVFDTGGMPLPAHVETDLAATAGAPPGEALPTTLVYADFALSYNVAAAVGAGPSLVYADFTLSYDVAAALPGVSLVYADFTISYGVAAATPPGGDIVLTPSVARTVNVQANNRAFTVAAPGFWNIENPKKPKGIKDSNSTTDISFNWAAWLADCADTIAEVEFEVTGGLTKVQTVPFDGLCTVIVSGGNPGGALVTCRITTNSSPPRIEDRTVELTIEER